MKKLMTLALAFVVLQVRSQGFEGTVKWTMTMEITDPKLKAEMAQAQQRMNDPATQAQMKEMQEKMNDPAMKAQMDANPQIKAQMENAMKMMQGGGAGAPGGGQNSMMPTGMMLKIKDGNTLTLMEGGMTAGMEILHMKDKEQSVRLDRANKTYTMMPAGQGGPGGSNNPPPKITKTGETKKILGYNCTKYIGEMTESGRTATMAFWTTTEIKDMDMKSLSKQRMGQGRSTMLPEGVEGVPMRIENASPQGNMIMEVAEIKRESLSASDFTIPSDFKETKMPGRN